MPQNFTRKQLFRNELEKLGYLRHDESTDSMILEAPLYDVMEIADQVFSD